MSVGVQASAPVENLGKDFPAVSTRSKPPKVTAAEVVKWFSKPPFPDETMVTALVGSINFPGVPWYLAPELPKTDPTYEHRKRLADALQVMAETLPSLLASWESHNAAGTVGIHRPVIMTDAMRATMTPWEIVREGVDQQVRALRALKRASDHATIAFGWVPRCPAPTRGAYHSLAVNIGSCVRACMLQAGHEKVSFLKPDGPAVKVVQRAMEHVEGFQREGSALVEALRKVKVGKQENRSPT